MDQPTSSLPEPAFAFVAGDPDADLRLDVALVAHVPGLGRARARELCDSGAVRVDGRRARRGMRLVVGAHVSCDREPTPSDFAARPDPGLVLTVRHEDAWLVVVDKPAGVPSHPLRPDELGTAAGALVARYPEMAGVGYRSREPGLVHRLDNDTSGLLLAARDAVTFEALRAALVAGDIDKHYEALVAGHVAGPVEVSEPLASDPRDARRMRVDLDGRPSFTEVVSARPVGSFTHLVVRAPRATRHQIRAHLASLGHPLVGDVLYGGPVLEGLHRHFLHASHLALLHPATGKPLVVASPLPPELVRALGEAP